MDGVTNVLLCTRDPCLQGYLASHCAAAHWPNLVHNLRNAKSVAGLRAAHDKYALLFFMNLYKFATFFLVF